jgi:hypothetical protein
LITARNQSAEKAHGDEKEWCAHFWANVRDDRSPPAFGMAPAREADSAGDMTKVPKAW